MLSIHENILDVNIKDKPDSSQRQAGLKSSTQLHSDAVLTDTITNSRKRIHLQHACLYHRKLQTITGLRSYNIKMTQALK